jgi:type IV pilus assembly protein PilM
LFEAEKYIPFRLEETSLDSAILGDRLVGRMKVLLAAAKTDLVRDHLELLKAAAVRPFSVDLEAIALANAWETNFVAGGPKVTGLVHVGARGTLIDFFLGPQLQFSRETGIGGDAFTQAVADGLQLDALEAEKIKCQPGQRLDAVRAALQPCWEEWLVQCRVSFDFYEDQFGQKVERLCLGGGSAHLIGFQEWIQQTTGFSTDLWNPVAGLTEGDHLDRLEAERIDLGVAVGLAVREVL